MKTGERIGIAWQAVLDRLPDGWQIDKLELTKRAMVVTADGSLTSATNVWITRARPEDGFAWKDFRERYLAEGYKASGRSPIEALLSLAIRVESGQPPSSVPPAPQEAVDALFEALFR